MAQILQLFFPRYVCVTSVGVKVFFGLGEKRGEADFSVSDNHLL